MRLISNEKLDEYCYRNRLIPPKIRRQLYAPATLTGFQMATPATFRDIGNKNPLFEIKYAQEFFDPDKVRENIGLQLYNAVGMLPKNRDIAKDRAATLLQRAISLQLGLMRDRRDRKKAAEIVAKELGAVFRAKRTVINNLADEAVDITSKAISEIYTQEIMIAAVNEAVDRIEFAKVLKEAMNVVKLHKEYLEQTTIEMDEANRKALEQISESEGAKPTGVESKQKPEPEPEETPGGSYEMETPQPALADIRFPITPMPYVEPPGVAEEKTDPLEEIEKLQKTNKELRERKDNIKKLQMGVDKDIQTLQTRIQSSKRDLPKKVPPRRRQFEAQIKADEEGLQRFQTELAGLKERERTLEQEIEFNDATIEEYKKDL